MKKNIKKILIGIILSSIVLFLFPNTINAQNYSSDFIKIFNTSYKYQDNELSISKVYFSKYNSISGGITSYGQLFGEITNLSRYNLDVYITIDYYDENYNLLARSKEIEKLNEISKSHMMNIELYDKDFFVEPNNNNIAYFKINYYTIKGNVLTNNNNITNQSKTPSKNSNYRNYDYVIDSYDINIKVNENNTYDITEKIEVYFNKEKHGIYRTIPLANTIERLDGTTSKNKAKISNLIVNENYTTSRENNNYKIKIGDANKTFTGKKFYEISYTYNIGKDKSEKYDEIYFNIIGSEWDTVIGNITFTITMPKDFDKNKIGFSSGIVGSTNSDKITYNVTNNIISGKYTDILKSGQALTFRTELPEGYFINAKNPITLSTYLFFIIPILCLLIAIILWHKYGKDKEVIEIVEFYPPEGFNSLQIGYLYKGKATTEDVTSLLIYLANKGYIKIVEKEQNKISDCDNKFEIVKLKDYDGNDENEELFLKGLFEKERKVDLDKVKQIVNDLKQYGQPINYYDAIKLATDVTERKSVTETDLYNNFYITTDKILNNINSKYNKKNIYESGTSFKSIIIILMIIISILTIVFIPTNEYASSEELMLTLFLTIFYIPFYAVGLIKDIPKGIKIFWVGFTLFHSSLVFISLPIMEAIMEERLYLIGFLIGITCIIAMTICFKAMPKRTKYGNEILGKIKGFKTFLETVEKEPLEKMVMQNPTYFYDLLPYTYVLGVSDKWINKFETINLQSPNWYSGSTDFNLNKFDSFIDNTMSSVTSAISTSTSSSYNGSSSSNSSGGGSSGGGSGGGGGGSW